MDMIYYLPKVRIVAVVSFWLAVVRVIPVQPVIYGSCKEGGKVHELYPGFFRTEEEQARLVWQYGRTIKPLTTRPLNHAGEVGGAGGGYFLNKEKNISSRGNHATYACGMEGTQGITRKAEDPLYHSCCQSYRVSTAPNTAQSLDGKMVRVVQNRCRKQYVLKEYCKQIPGCLDCTCGQPRPNVKLVVVYGRRNKKNRVPVYKLEYIQVPGCCKCLNI